MIRKLIASSTLVIAAVAGVASVSSVTQTGPAEAQGVCLIVTTSGLVNSGPTGGCRYEYPLGVNCQDIKTGLTPTQEVNVYECVPH